MQRISDFDSQFWLKLTDSLKKKIQSKPRKSTHWMKFLALQILLLSLPILGKNVFFALRFRFKALNYFLSQKHELQLLYSWLNDSYSKALLIDIVVRKIFGQDHLEPLISKEVEQKRRSHVIPLTIEKHTGSVKMGSIVFELNYYDLASIGYAVKVHLYDLGVVYTFMVEQYRYIHGEVDISVEANDIVIDAGGCWGDTALYMAAKKAGHVYCFEFVKENLLVLRKNVEENPPYADYISVIEKAVWDKDNITLSFNAAGPGTRVQVDNTAQQTVSTVTIDSFVEQQKLLYIDFIKMDIEGAELNALIGAQETIKRFGPKLAVTVYHKQEDLCTIPHFLKMLRPDYELYLDHFTPTMEETVLFARQKSVNKYT